MSLKDYIKSRCEKDKILETDETQKDLNKNQLKEENENSQVKMVPAWTINLDNAKIKGKEYLKNLIKHKDIIFK